ncbi:MAG: PepSY domain-containing protein, partial [Cyanobacteriota bacterium]|nr:PepSY domain-containing protein [Cyanobacteriota bacterium]
MAPLNPVAARRLHRRLAPLLMAPLLLAAVTGLAGRLGRSWFGLPKSVANRLFSIHAGGFL